MNGKMSAICHTFLANTWRKDICSNCFRLREEHSDLNLYNSSNNNNNNHSGHHHHYNQQQQQNGGSSSSGKNSMLMNNNNHHSSSNNNNNHSISILVKDTSMMMSNGRSPTGRYQSPTTGIPRVSSLSKYQTNSSRSPSGSSSSSSLNSDHNNHLKGTKPSTNGNSNDSSGAEVIRLGLSNGGGVQSKKFVAHPLKGDKEGASYNNNNHSSSNNNRTNVNNVLNGTSSSSSSTVVSVSMNGNGMSAPPPPTTKHHHHHSSTITGSSLSSGSNTTSSSHYNNNHQSNANSSSHSVTNENNITNSNKRTTTNSSSNSTSSVLSLASHTKNHSSQQQRNNHNSTSSSSSSNHHSQKNLNGTTTAGSSKSTNSNSATLTKFDGDTNNTMENNNNNNTVVKSVPNNRFVNNNNYNTSKGDSPDCADFSQQNKKNLTLLANGHSNKHYKGILKALDGKKRRKLNVKFPEEVCEVIGYGGNEEGEGPDEDEEEVSEDPQDMVSVAELMASNSTTNEEKEINRLTVKNTNFNSIKTNLLGYAPIEIGPIVGCTGGKSMESSSKPLVSIGTFEARKEPLRIRKSGDDFVVETTTSPSSSVQVNKKEEEKKQVVVVEPAKASKIMSTTSTTTSSKNSSNNHVTNQESKVTNKRVVVENVVVDVNVNTTKSTINSTAGGGRQCQSNSSGGVGTGVKINGKDVTENNGISTIEVNPDKSAIKIVSSSKSNPSPSSLTTNSSVTTTVSPVQSSHAASAAAGAERPKPKPILKNNQLQQNNEHTTTTTIASNTNNKKNSGGGDKPENNSLTNLIILNGGNIASKRTSFLQEIISPSSSSSLSTSMTTTSNMDPVTVLTSQMDIMSGGGGGGGDVVEDITSLNLDKDSLEATVGVVDTSNNSSSRGSSNNNTTRVYSKADIKINSKLSNTTTNNNNNNLKSYEFECDNTSEFDDSLDDSGLDIGRRHHHRDHDGSTNRGGGGIVENSESDDNDTEKFGSSSDSGNENDYHENRMVVPKGGLYISVDEEEEEDGKMLTREDSTKPKLSPDSVLFSSASSGSSESIPECVNRHVISSTVVKRPAPLPPPPLPTSLAPTKTMSDYHLNGHGVIVNEQHQQSNCDDVYDDVGTYQESRRKRMIVEQAAGQHQQQQEGEEEEESIYDDCTSIAAAASANGGKSVTGHYDFTNGTRTILDTDGSSDLHEKIPLRPSDGIEFIGIRKIDSETHLNATIPHCGGKDRSPSPENAKRSSSVSPKARRKVNHFFSTIGKKAGAAFSSHNPLSGTAGFIRNKSPSPIPVSSSVTAYKRSLSQDEVSMTRTQEIYATITPTSLKFKGLAPVLQKLSRMDLDTVGKEDCNNSSNSKENGKEKMFKKHKILPSIRNFLRMGGSTKSGEMMGPGGIDNNNRSSYDFKTELKHSNSNSNILGGGGGSTSSGESSSICASSSESSSNPSSLLSDESACAGSSSSGGSSSSNSGEFNKSRVGGGNNAPNPTTTTTTMVKPVIAARPIPPLGRPPPPPPRVHSLDLLNKVGVSSSNNGGTMTGQMKPARPPPPVRSNRIAPSFVSVFAAQEDDLGSRSSSSDHSTVTTPTSNMGGGPPNKPKRKASMNSHSSGSQHHHHLHNGGRNNSSSSGSDGDQSLENNVVSLNFETLKLIASQVPKKIKRKPEFLLVKFSGSPIRWSQFYVSSVEPLARGDRFVFYSALWEEEPCVLLLQETSEQFPLLQFTCVEVSAKFDDFVPIALVPWSSSECAEDCTDMKVNISVLPSCTIQRISDYIGSRSFSPMQKYFALLQTLEYWGREEMDDLLVFQGGSQDEQTPEDAELVYVVPITHNNNNKKSNNNKRPSSYSQLSSNFEISIKQLLLQPTVLSGDDRQSLFRMISGTPQEVEAQIKLFLQAKLFGHKIRPEDLEKLRRNKSTSNSERVFYQWMEKERALAMHDAIERTLKNEPITPLKKTFVELLLIPASSAKVLLEMLLDLIN